MTRLAQLLRAATVVAVGCGAITGVTTAAQSAAPAPGKKELVARIVQLQMPGIESLAQSLVERPAALMLQDASQALSNQVAAERREDAGKRIQESAKRYVDEAAPLIRGRAARLAPGVLGPQLEATFSEAELTQLVAWLESPIYRKYQQTLPQLQDNFVQKLVADARPQIDPMLLELEQEIRGTLGLSPLAHKPMQAASAAASRKK